MPKIIHLEITDQCNMACPMCGTLDHRRHDGTLRLNREGILEQVLQPGYQLGLRVLVISGGEPTLAPHLNVTVKDALALGFRNIFLATNLLQFCESTFNMLLTDLDVDQHVIQTSFDSLVPLEMNRIRGRKVYDDVLVNCQRLQALKKATGSQVRLSAVIVIQPENVHSILETIHFVLDTLKFDLVLVQLRHDYQTPITAKNFRQQLGRAYDEETRKALLQTVKTVFDIAQNDERILIEKGTEEDWHRFLIDPQSGQKDCTCTAAVYVDAYGYYRGCVMGDVLGNVQESTLEKYLASDTYAAFCAFSRQCHLCTHGCS